MAKVQFIATDGSRPKESNMNLSLDFLPKYLSYHCVLYNAYTCIKTLLYQQNPSV